MLLGGPGVYDKKCFAYEDLSILLLFLIITVIVLRGYEFRFINNTQVVEVAVGGVCVCEC